MRAPRLTELLAVLLLVFVFLLLVPPWYGNPKVAAKGTACLSNVKQTSTGLLLYADDADERWPPRDAWMDAVAPYTKSPGLFRCPSLPMGSYGYAFNGALSTAKMPKEGVDAVTPLLYESANPMRNASDLVKSLPTPGRHTGKNSVGYADGHATRVRP